MARSIRALRFPFAATLSSTATVEVGRMTLMRLFIDEILRNELVFKIRTPRVDVKSGRQVAARADCGRTLARLHGDFDTLLVGAEVGVLVDKTSETMAVV